MRAGHCPRDTIINCIHTHTLMPHVLALYERNTLQLHSHILVSAEVSDMQIPFKASTLSRTGDNLCPHLRGEWICRNACATIFRGPGPCDGFVCGVCSFVLFQPNVFPRKCGNSLPKNLATGTAFLPKEVFVDPGKNCTVASKRIKKQTSFLVR